MAKPPPKKRPLATRSKPSAPARSARKKQPATPLLRQEDLRAILYDLANKVAPADVEEMMEHEDTLRAEAAQITSPHLALLRDQLLLAVDCLSDHVNGECPQIPYHTIALLAAGVFYFSDEIDVIPDFLPHIGMLDDAAVMAMAYRLAEDGVRRYCDFKGRASDGVLSTPTHHDPHSVSTREP